MCIEKCTLIEHFLDPEGDSFYAIKFNMFLLGLCIIRLSLLDCHGS